jgi:hypothetical protein
MKVTATQTGTMVAVYVDGPPTPTSFTWGFQTFDQAAAFANAINGKAKDSAPAATSDEATVAAIGVVSKLADNIEAARRDHLMDLRAMLVAKAKILNG